jgi:hypothetical protein
MASGLDHWKNAESALADAAAAIDAGDYSHGMALVGLAQGHAKLAEISLYLELTPGELRDEAEWKNETAGAFY